MIKERLNAGHLIAIGGSIGTGKTTLAYRLCDLIGESCHVMESDTFRRAHFGYDLGYRMTPDDYTDEVNKVIFELMDMRMEEVLQRGSTVIFCSTGKNAAAYDKSRELADRVGARFDGLFLTASEATIRKRLDKRLAERAASDRLSVARGHASDADHGVLSKYPIPDYVPDGWVAINAEYGEDAVFLNAATVLGLLHTNLAHFQLP